MYYGNWFLLISDVLADDVAAGIDLPCRTEARGSIFLKSKAISVYDNLLFRYIPGILICCMIILNFADLNLVGIFLVTLGRVRIGIICELLGFLNLFGWVNHSLFDLAKIFD